MEEKEIIRYKGNFKKISKIIVCISLAIFIICFSISIVISSINTYHKNQKVKLEENYNQKLKIEIEKDNIRNKKVDIRNDIEHNISFRSLHLPPLEWQAAIDNDPEYKKAVEEFEKALQDYTEAKGDTEKAYQEYKNYTYVIYDFSVFASLARTFLFCTIITIIFYLYMSKMEIIVTNTRVYGKKAFGKRVDLPLDTISSVGTSFLKGIDIGTSSGRIHFKGIMNNQEIHTEISKLLNARQGSPQVNNTDTTEELTKYKNLLDTGVITQEEFDAKKKQLLDL